MCDVPFTILQLRILNAIYTEGNFTKAAKKLYISQPAVSAQMKILEEHLNTNVFNRNKRQRSLTETGQILLKYSTRIRILRCARARGSSGSNNVNSWSGNHHTPRHQNVAARPKTRTKRASPSK